jgi:hypothetical protein
VASNGRNLDESRISLFLSLTLLSPFSDSVLTWHLNRSSNGDVYKERSGRFVPHKLNFIELLEAELEELVLSTLAAFFAIASVEWLSEG